MVCTSPARGRKLWSSIASCTRATTERVQGQSPSLFKTMKIYNKTMKIYIAPTLLSLHLDSEALIANSDDKMRKVQILDIESQTTDVLIWTNEVGDAAEGV